MIHFVLLISRQGKVRLTKWYSPYTRKKEQRYASLYLCMCINQDDNELEILELMHHYVDILDRYFGSAYYILEELLLAGELQESSKRTVARLIAAQDSAVEAAKEEASSISNVINPATK